MKKILALALSLLMSSTGQAQVTSVVQRGGSNFNWYKTDCVNYPPTGREPFGVIVNYNTQTAAIQTALHNMRNAGQDKIRLMLFFGHGLTSGTLMDSTGGHLSTQNMLNLKNLIQYIHAIGFSELHISFGPQGGNDPSSWGSTLNQTLADENWGVINSVHQAIVNPGFNKIYYDLGNEMMTSSQTNARYKYMKYIWPKYFSLYGSLSDSVGFSFASGEVGAISNMGAIYGHNSYPVMVDIHIYPYGSETAGDILYAAAHNLKAIGPYPGQYRFVIGEANFNNNADAASMAAQLNALASNDSKPWYLMQWPIDSTSPTCTVGNVAPFANYEAHGF